jgi:hypothetical protein
MDTARVSTYGSISSIPHLSKRFALKRFLGLTAEEIAENEKLWREENTDTAQSATDAQSEMRSMGITSSGIGSDMNMLGQSDMGSPALQGADPGAAPAELGGATPAATPPPAGGAPTL